MDGSIGASESRGPPSYAERWLWQVLLLTVVAIAAATFFASSLGPSSVSEPTFAGEGGEARAERAYGELPLAFEPSDGPGRPDVDFISHSASGTVLLGPKQTTLALGHAAGAAAIGFEFVGAAGAAEPVPLERLPGVVNRLLGDDPDRWRTEIPTFERVRYPGLWPGIDIDYYGNQRRLEYDFRLAAGADPTRIALRIAGADRLRLASNGDLLITAGTETVRQRAPVAYQPAGETGAGEAGRIPVPAAFALSGETIRFRLGRYDERRPLVIDPLVLAYSTYLGGDNADKGNGIAVDDSGAAYVVGETDSSDFDTVDPIEGDSATTDVFVSKLTPAGNALEYSTYLGGDHQEWGRAIAVDNSGAAYITGQTWSSDFDTVGEIEGDPVVGPDAFVSKLTPAGSGLEYSTYLGGDRDDNGTGIAVDDAGAAYVTGSTGSSDFNTVGAIELDPAGDDAFISKLTPAGDALTYSTLLGGNGGDWGTGIAVDASGVAYVAGRTESTNFDTVGAIEGDSPGSDAFVSKLTPAGNALAYSTYLGGNSSDGAAAIAVDASGAAYVAGGTSSSDFNTVNPIEFYSGDVDVFVSKLNPAGSGLEYSTYLGAKEFEVGTGIAVDASGAAYVVGHTHSHLFNTVDPIELDGPGRDLVVFKLTGTGMALEYSTYLGGDARDDGNAIAVDGSGAAYVTGLTESTDFNTVGPIEGDSGPDSGDAFVSKLATKPSTPAPTMTGTDPVPPANDNEPEVIGNAAPGSTVKIYATLDCSGTPLATGSAAEFATSGLSASVPDDSTTDFRATADAGGAVSLCSSAFTYVEDSTPPAPPTITSTDPVSPADDNEPEVQGTVGGGDPLEVRVYENADCTGGPGATGTVPVFTGTGITVAVEEDSATEISARTIDQAGNESTCSNSLTYREDSTAPAEPVLTRTDPDSPANDNAPDVEGTAETDATVRLYTSADCSGVPSGFGSAAEFAAPGIQVSVPDNSTTTFRGTATDAAGHVSACSTMSLTYLEVSSAPTAALAISPNPVLTGDAVTFDASASAGLAIARYEWDLDGNGSFETNTGAEPTAVRSFSNPASIDAGVRVTNQLGLSGEARVTLAVRLRPPDGPLGVSINGGDPFTNDPEVTVDAIWPRFAETMLISNDGGFASPGSFAVAPETSWLLDSPGSERLPRTIYVRFTGGESGAETYQDDIVLDQVAPEIVTATATSPNSPGARRAGAKKVTYRIRLEVRERNSGVETMQITNKKRRPGDSLAYKRVRRFRSATGRIYVRVTDRAGNSSPWQRVTVRR